MKRQLRVGLESGNNKLNMTEVGQIKSEAGFNQQNEIVSIPDMEEKSVISEDNSVMEWDEAVWTMEKGMNKTNGNDILFESIPSMVVNLDEEKKAEFVVNEQNRVEQESLSKEQKLRDETKRTVVEISEIKPANKKAGENGNIEKEKSDLENNIKLVCNILDEVSINLENRRKRISYLTMQLEERTRMLKRLEETEDIASGYFLPEELNSNKKEQAVFRSEMEEIQNLLLTAREKEKIWEERKQKLKQLLRYLKNRKKVIVSEESRIENYTGSACIEHSEEKNTLNQLKENNNVNALAVNEYMMILHKIEFIMQLIDLDGVRAKMELLELENTVKRAISEKR